MKKQIKRQGLSLIMLVIVIVVIVILAVAVIATISKNNPIDSAKYARAINDLATLNEKVQLATITNLATSNNELMKLFELNNVKAEDLGITDTLLEEIGMYRNWYYTNTVPNLAISYKDELVNTPTGISDLYYFAKDGGIKEKQYIYDKVNGVVYDKKGLAIDKKSGFSIYALKGLQQGNILLEEPVFSSGITANTPVEKANYKLISSGSGWLFKHYDNGDVYGVGPKGAEMNTSQTEMDAIDINKWQEFKVPEVIGSYKKVISGFGCMYFIDNNDELWVWGSNGYNKFGLTDEQMRSYTGRTAIKLDVAGLKVKDVYGGNANTFVVTTTNEVYAAGTNLNYNFGLGHSKELKGFIKINLPKIEKVKNIQTNDRNTLVEYSDNTYYFSGTNGFGLIGINSYTTFETFSQIWNTAPYDIDQDIKEVITNGVTINILKNDKTIWGAGYREYTGGDLSGSSAVFQKYPEPFGSDIKEIYFDSNILIVKQGVSGVEYYASERQGSNIMGINNGIDVNNAKLEKINFPVGMNQNKIKEVINVYNMGVFYIMNNGEVFGSGRYAFKADGNPSYEVEKINMPLIETANNISNVINSKNEMVGNIIFKGKDGKLYTIENGVYMGDRAIETSWTKVASNVLKFTPGAYIDKNNDLYVSGNDARWLGLNKTSISKVPQYIKHTDSRFFSNVKDVYKICRGASIQNLYIITNDNKLYATGTFNQGCEVSGWVGADDKYEFVEILQNVESFSGTFRWAQAKTNTNIYGWGAYGNYAINSGYSNVPKINNLPSELSIANVKQVISNVVTSFIVTNSGELWASGIHSASFTGLGTVLQYTKHNPITFKNEKIVEFSTSNDSSRYALTDAGNVYVWGKNQYLGIGDSSTSNITQTPIKSNISDVIDIECGNRFVVATKKNGEVWATGENFNATLGRWIDKNGNYAKSNTETIFDWVRCPMLEK